jgi:predicted small secreted protein
MVRRIIDAIVRVILLVAFLSGLAACQTVRGSFCDVAKPIRLSDATVDAMADAEVKEALAHNEKGRKLCRWKP